jgi:hypothetical protein
MVAGLRLNNSSAWAAFDKMEEKVMAMESEAESAGLLATPDNIEAQFARLEGGWRVGRTGCVHRSTCSRWKGLGQQLSPDQSTAALLEVGCLTRDTSALTY